MSTVKFKLSNSKVNLIFSGRGWLSFGDNHCTNKNQEKPQVMSERKPDSKYTPPPRKQANNWVDIMVDTNLVLCLYPRIFNPCGIHILGDKRIVLTVLCLKSRHQLILYPTRSWIGRLLQAPHAENLEHLLSIWHNPVKIHQQLPVYSIQVTWKFNHCALGTMHIPKWSHINWAIFWFALPLVPTEIFVMKMNLERNEIFRFVVFVHCLRTKSRM